MTTPTPAKPLLSLSPLTILDASPPEQVIAAAAAGFDAIGVRVAPAADEKVWPMLGDTPTVRETRARLDDSGLCILDVELIVLRPDFDRDAALRVLDAGHRLGARFAATLGYDADEQRLTDNFRWLCESAAERNLRPGLEFMKYSHVRTLQQAVRIVQSSDHPAGTVLVDALHLQRSGGTAAELALVPPELTPYGQLCDGQLEPVWPSDDEARTESRTGRLLPGDGAFPLADLIGALPTDAVYSVEAPVAALSGETAHRRAQLAFQAAARALRVAATATHPGSKDSD